MRKGYLENRSPGLQLLVLIVLVFISGIVGMLLSISLGTMFWSKEFMLVLMNGEESSIFYYGNVFLIFFQHLSFFILPAFFFAYGFEKKWYAYFKLDHGLTILQISLIFLLYVLIQFPLGWIYELNQQINLPNFMSSIESQLKAMEESANELFSYLAAYEGWEGWVLSFFIIAVLPAFSEEIFFRGTLQRWLQMRMNSWLAITITSIVFSFLHFQFYGFFARFALGFFLGYLFYRTNSLWASMFFHFVNNAIAFVLKRLYELGATSFNPDDASLFTDHPLLLVSMTLLFVGAVYIFEKKGISHG